MPQYNFPIPPSRGLGPAACGNSLRRVAIEVTDLVYQGNGAIVTFNDCSTAVAMLKVIDGDVRIIGLTNEQAEALYRFNRDHIGDEVKQLDHRHDIGPDTLSELEDVDLDGIKDDDLLTYDDSLGKWVPTDNYYNKDEIDALLLSICELSTVTTITEDYTIAEISGDIDSVDVVLCDASSSDITVTLPEAANSEGRLLYLKKIDSSENIVIIKGCENDEIDEGVLANIENQYESLTLLCDGENWHIL